MPPPTRASADEMANIKGSASDKTTAIALAMPRVRCVNFMSLFLSPRQGDAPLRWAAPPKSEAIIGNRGCGPRSRAGGDWADFRVVSGLEGFKSSLLANGSREWAPDYRLRHTIHNRQPRL